jgi:hypothetical protein
MGVVRSNLENINIDGARGITCVWTGITGKSNHFDLLAIFGQLSLQPFDLRRLSRPIKTFNDNERAATNRFFFCHRVLRRSILRMTREETSRGNKPRIALRIMRALTSAATFLKWDDQNCQHTNSKYTCEGQEPKDGSASTGATAFRGDVCRERS